MTCGPASSKAITSSTSEARTPGGRNGNNSMMRTIIARLLPLSPLRAKDFGSDFLSHFPASGPSARVTDFAYVVLIFAHSVA